MPSLEDPYFEKVVVYICEHNDNGAVGLIINRPTEYNLQFILDQLGIESEDAINSQQPVLFGGPVQQDRGFVIHRPLADFDESLGITPEICISTSQEILRRIPKGKGPDDALITLGYAGWAAEQLDDEIKDNIWLTCAANDKIMYNTPFGERWQAAVDTIGIDLSKLISSSGHA